MTSLKDVFYKEMKPMKTVQRNMNQRPHVSSKFYKASKNYKKNYQTGRKPSDIKPRFASPIPPRLKGKYAK